MSLSKAGIERCIGMLNINTIATATINDMGYNETGTYNIMANMTFGTV